MVSNKMLIKLSKEESFRHKLLLWFGTHENEIFSQTDLSNILKVKRSTLNYYIVGFEKEGIVDESLQLTSQEKE